MSKSSIDYDISTSFLASGFLTFLTTAVLGLSGGEPQTPVSYLTFFDFSVFLGFELN